MKASGSIQVFDGFKKIYNFKDPKEEEQTLPDLEKKENILVNNLNIKQNFTKPPNRYSEAGLIKKLEELGIGRPSTYVSIFTKLEKNTYINIKNKALIPTSKGKILSKFLDGFFDKFVDYSFTAGLEEQLDKITESKLDWKTTLQKFLDLLNQTVDEVEKHSISQVIDKINEESPEILKEQKCPKCKDGTLTIKFSYTGPFIGCTNYNKDSNGCNYSHAIGDDEENKELSGDGKLIGINPSSNNQILLKIGRYGRYLETPSDENKPKRISIPKKMKNEEIDLDKSIKLLSLPRKIGEHPESKKIIVASIGPYGPYLKHDNKFISLKEDDVTEIGINRAIELIEENLKLKKEIEIGKHPDSKKSIIQKKGIKGRPDYLSYNKKNYSIPKELTDKKISLQDALKVIDEKVQKKKKLSKRINLSDIIDAEIKSTSLRQGFSNRIISQLKSIRKFDENSHKDFTSIPFITIDGENSKDFDDAVYCEVNNNNTRIMVAIADVSFFVEKNDPIDLEARKRGNSFYFPDRVIPMLPEKLSNDICSLIPRKIRACVICEIQIKGDKIDKYEFHRGKIKSVARLTYKEVDEIQSNKKSKYFGLVKNLFHALGILVKVSEKRGKLRFNNQEYEVNFKNSEEFEFKKKKIINHID